MVRIALWTDWFKRRHMTATLGRLFRLVDWINNSGCLLTKSVSHGGNNAFRMTRDVQIQRTHFVVFTVMMWSIAESTCWPPVSFYHSRLIRPYTNIDVDAKAPFFWLPDDISPVAGTRKHPLPDHGNKNRSDKYPRIDGCHNGKECIVGHYRTLYVDRSRRIQYVTRCSKPVSTSVRRPLCQLFLSAILFNHPLENRVISA